MLLNADKLLMCLLPSMKGKSFPSTGFVSTIYCLQAGVRSAKTGTLESHISA